MVRFSFFFFSHFCVFLLRCELSSQNFTRSWCYVVNFLLRMVHALDSDATVWTFFLEVYMFLMLRCELSSGGGLGGCDNVLSLAFLLTSFCWCYVVNFLLRMAHALDATLWTFFSEWHTLLMLRCELSSWKFTCSWCYVVNFLRGGGWGGFGGVITFCRLCSSWLRSVDATLWTFFSDFFHVLLMLRMCGTTSSTAQGGGGSFRIGNL